MRFEVVDRRCAELMRRMTGTQRLERAFAKWDEVRSNVRNFLRKEHPDWTTEQLDKEMLRKAGYVRTVVPNFHF